MTTTFDLSLLPASAAVDDAGRVSIGGVSLADIASEFGTPCYVYDEDEIRARCRAYVARFGAGAAYASKAFLCTAMARLVEEEGMHLDVATGGELHVALHAGFPAERIVFHGNNKSEEELRAALTAGIGRIAVDSTNELERLEQLVGAGAPAPRVMIRVRPGVEAHTHEYIETGAEDSKFGFSLERGDALEAARRVVERGVLRFAGLHCHIGSHVFRLDSFTRAIEKMVGLVRALEDATGALVEELNVGGGLGVRYLPEDTPPSIDEYAAVLQESVAKALADAGTRSRPMLMVEPGRSIVATAGLTLYTVGTIKDGARLYVAVDGGMSDNLRPVTYGARYETFLPERATAERPLIATIAGKHCEQGDIIVKDARLPADLAVGDLLATPVTGAYGYAMASNYNKVTRPAVVFVRAGQARRVVRRESPDDLVRLDE
ncbi:MAG TPA: diaminopimelate decarboxylase [Acidimicrobiia bacterium]|jgi:diaminopimelate decarboxylase|nr:diaminopimelate decarboxylase [Acidimicrobiia bacterium]